MNFINIKIQQCSFNCFERDFRMRAEEGVRRPLYNAQEQRRGWNTPLVITALRSAGAARQLVYIRRVAD